MIKAAMKKECADMKEGEAELMKNKMRKALVEVLSEEYTDEEIEKAMKKGEEEGGPKEIDIKIEAPSEDKKEEKPVVMAEEASEEKPDMVEAKPDMEKKMKKALELISKSQELLNMGEKDLARDIFLKAKEMMASDIAEAKQVDQSKSEVGMNMGKGKLKQPEPADEAKTKADDVKAPMAKSIKWYGEENDAFKAGRLGRHSYASSVNSYYDDMIAKSVAAESEVKEELKKSFDANNIEDLIESDLTKSDISIQEDVRMEEFKKSQGSFTKHSFDEADMLKSLGITQEEADKL